MHIASVFDCGTEQGQPDSGGPALRPVHQTLPALRVQLESDACTQIFSLAWRERQHGGIDLAKPSHHLQTAQRYSRFHA
ncbi:Uncharacterised protein [Mycobacteroides abscessus subsp. abscessus]|nr:Uncharacterised protein [Mycobacteroides abscessus subsp. abscessus]